MKNLDYRLAREHSCELVRQPAFGTAELDVTTHIDHPQLTSMPSGDGEAPLDRNLFRPLLGAET